MADVISQNVQFTETFGGVGVAVNSVDVVNREFLSIEVTGVDPTNQIDVKGRLQDGSFETIWTIIGNISIKSISCAKWDDVQIECIVFASAGSGTVAVSAHDSNYDESFENLVTTLVENNITYEAATKEPTADQSQPVWRISREYTTGNVTNKQFANCGYFTEVLADRNSIFPPAPLINNLSLNFDGVDDHVDIPSSGLIDFDANSEAFSFSIWWKRVVPNITQMACFGNLAFADAPTFTSINLFGNTTAMSALFVADNSAANTISKNFTITGLVQNDVWHHYCLTNDGSGTAAGVKFYFDGSEITGAVANDNLTASTSTANPIQIANVASDGILFPALGNMDEASIWTVELTAAEVSEAYNEGKPPDLLKHSRYLSNNTSMPLWYRMGDGDTFPTLINSGDAGVALDGTMTNMVAGDIEGDVP